MPAGLTATDKMFSVREVPWHRLGEIKQDYPTWDEAREASMPWEVITEPVFRRVPVIHAHTDDCYRDYGYGDAVLTCALSELGEAYEEVPGRKLHVRSDNNAVLGDVNSELGLVTNRELWEVAQAVGEAEATDELGRPMVETAGSLYGGVKVWALLRFSEPIKIKGDPHGGSLALFALQNDHASMGSFRGQSINTRICCANTSAAADAEAQRTGHEFTFRHTAKVGDRIEEAKQAIALWRSDVSLWKNVMEHLVTVEVNETQTREFIERFQPMPPEHLTTDRVMGNVLKARQELFTILNGETCADIDRTAYGLFQAGVEWSQHYRTAKGKDERGRMESHFKRAVLNDSGLRRSTLDLVREVAHA